MRRFLVTLAIVIGTIIVLPFAVRLLTGGADARLRPPPGRTVPIGDGLALNVVEVGSGAPVVLVHGLPSCAADWAEGPQQLAARGYRVIAYDRMGYGYSSRPAATPERYTVESNARDLGALLDALGIAQATLVGWSYGGAVVQTLAQQAPQRVSHLVLVAAVGPALPRDRGNGLDRILQSPLGGPLLKWVAGVPPLSRSMTHANLVEAFARDADIPPLWTEYTRAMLALPGTLDTFVWEAQRGRYDTLTPQTLHVPALVVQGSDDLLVAPAVAEDLHRKLAGSELVMVPHGSHMLPVTHAALLAERIDAFLRR